jgi:two-component system phosphate regulon sensor histidine kinase PhoR
LLGVLLSILATYFMARGISRPLKALTSTATAISAGDISRRFRRYPPNEVGELGRAFDRMTDTIQDKIEAVTMTRDRLAGVLRGMAEGVLVTDREGRILLTNNALAEMLDLTEDPVGKMPSEIFRNADLVQAMRQARLSGEQKTSEIRTIDPDPRYLELTVVRLPATETGAGCVAVLHDVTEHRRTEEIRRDFVANVSHELRTPLAAIRGSAETLLDSALESPDFARRFVEMIRRQAERLENLSKDLLELAKVETGSAGASPEMVRLTELADSVLSTVSDLAVQQGIDLFSERDDVDQTLWADRRQLEEAILNLMVNAIKYTEKGGKVTLAMRKTPKQTRIEVIDTGMGIPREHLPRIFERFYRVDRNRSRQMGGTGLGLAIVKHLTQAQGGRVEVESEPGKGSTFSLVFEQ